jgi:hypothetical protein
MYLVLCDSHDLAALWAWRELRQRLDGVELITADALAYAVRWEHRVDSKQTSTTITLADGRVIRTSDVRGTINRIARLPFDHFRATAADREYAAAEQLAFFASWMHALPKPVLNPASPSGLNGGAQWRDHSEWLLLALQCGLDVAPYVESDSDEVTLPPLTDTQSLIVIGDRVLGAPHPAPIADGCLALAHRANLGILGLAFSSDWSFLYADVLPDLRLAGRAGIDALEGALA